VLAIVAWIGAFTALLAAVLACVQDDIKRVLAYSTVSQLGYMMTAIGAGYSARRLLPPAHARHLQGAPLPRRRRGHPRRRQQRPPHMGGLARRMPQTAIVFIIGTLSLAGIPLFGGFASKEEFSARSWAGGFAGPFVLLMLVAFLTAFYMFRVVFLAFFGSPAVHIARTRTTTRAVAQPSARGTCGGCACGRGAARARSAATMALPLWLLAVLSMAVGIYFTIEKGEPSSSARHG
jgi:NADH-quinone oxidoreductase subunit L